MIGLFLFPPTWMGLEGLGGGWGQWWTFAYWAAWGLCIARRGDGSQGRGEDDEREIWVAM